MIDIREVVNMDGLIRFAVWTLAVFGLSHALFRSFLAQELTGWMMQKPNRRLAEANRLQFELRSGLRFHPGLARGDKDAPKESLSPAELDEKKQQLREQSRKTLPHRALAFGLSCNICQNFWAGVALYVATATEWSVGYGACTAAAHAVAAMLLGKTIAGGVSDGRTGRSCGA